jgi:hypothetical protein
MLRFLGGAKPPRGTKTPKLVVTSAPTWCTGMLAVVPRDVLVESPLQQAHSAR